MEQPLNDDKPAGAASALTDVLEVVGVINELGNIEQAMKRKPWLSEKDDKAWRNWWYSRDCFEKVYRVKSNAPHEGASGIAAKLPLDAVVGGAVSPEPTFEQGDKA